MAIDAGIYGQIQPVQQTNPLNALAQAMQIRGAQAQLDRADRAEQQQNKLLQLVGTPDFAALPAAQKAARLQGIGAFDQAGKIVESDAKANKDAREAEKFQLEGNIKRMELIGQVAGTVRDQASYTQGLQMLQSYGIDTSKFNPNYDPAGVAQFANAAMSRKDQMEQEWKAKGYSLDVQKVAETARHNRTSEENAVRGQDMTDARAREFNATKVEENKLKREQKQETADMTKASQVASFDTMLGTLDRLAQHPGLKRSVGLVGKLPTMPGSDSANFQAELDTFQSQAFVPMVAQLKGMGALSDAEGKKLTQAVGALNPNMGEKAFRESIARIKSDMEAARKRVVGTKQSADQPQLTRKTIGGKTYENDGKGWYLVN